MFNCPPGFKHLAVIMDGNGRWAAHRRRPRAFGHLRGVQTLKDIVKTCSKIKIPYLTVFVFSTENWKRSSLEVSLLMKIIQRSLKSYQNMMKQNQIRLHVLGGLKAMNPAIQKLCADVMEETKNGQGLQLIMALNYGGRNEIVQAARKAGELIQAGRLQPKDITEKTLGGFLSSSVFPPPDLIIRTGNVSRLSNFYLWNAAYSEFYVSSVMWPDFTVEHLIKALDFYAGTQRRFGAVGSSPAEGRA